MTSLPPSLSPIRPVKELVRRKYPQHVLEEALRLCATDGVDYAATTCNVSKWTLYKLLKPAKTIARKERKVKPKPISPEKALLSAPIWHKIKALALYYHANVPNDSLRNAYARAAMKTGHDVKIVWRSAKLEKYST